MQFHKNVCVKFPSCLFQPYNIHQTTTMKSTIWMKSTSESISQYNQHAELIKGMLQCLFYHTSKMFVSNSYHVYFIHIYTPSKLKQRCEWNLVNPFLLYNQHAELIKGMLPVSVLSHINISIIYSENAFKYLLLYYSLR